MPGRDLIRTPQLRRSQLLRRINKGLRPLQRSNLCESPGQSRGHISMSYIHPPLQDAGTGGQDLAGWLWRGDCWRCRQPTHRRARTHRPSCDAWPRSRSRAAHIARSGAGGCRSNSPPTGQPWQPSPPRHAVGRHERHTLPHVPCQVWLRTQAGVSTCRPRRGGRRCAAQAGFSDAGGASGAITRWWAPRATRCATHRSCQHAPLKLTLPIPPPCRRFSSTRFICRHGAPWLRSALPGRQINAVC